MCVHVVGVHRHQTNSTDRKIKLGVFVSHAPTLRVQLDGALVVLRDAVPVVVENPEANLRESVPLEGSLLKPLGGLLVALFAPEPVPERFAERAHRLNIALKSTLLEPVDRLFVVLFASLPP